MAPAVRAPRGPWLVAAGLFVVLAAYGGRYGYHRDELYFIEAGRHPAWGYPDQPPLVPLLATAWDAAVGGRLWLFRLVPAFVAALVAPLTALTSARLGGSVREQLVAALLGAVMTVTVATGHLFSTATFDLTLTVGTVMLALRALDERSLASWLVLGLLAGIGMQVQLLPGVVLACGVLALLLVGPRGVLRSPGPWVGAAMAFLIAAPYLLWQQLHSWPQLDVAADIAAGNSTSSQPRWAIIPFQLVMTGPFICPVLVAGAWALARSPALRHRRWLVVAYALLLVVITVTGGKPYYASGLVPAVVAAGVPATLRWMQRARWRTVIGGALLVLHIFGTLTVCLPVYPVGSSGYKVADGANPDTGETVGWDRFTAQVATAVAETSMLNPAPASGAGMIVLAENYGEAGALDRASREGTALPDIYSGHNAYGQWGPPPPSARSAVVVGYERSDTAAWFTSCRKLGTVTTGVDNDENDGLIQFCTGLRGPWPQLWKSIRFVG